MALLEREVFGPILHVVRFERGHLDKVCDAINASGYGLTLGLHSRIAAVADFVAEHARVGNLYVNRNQIGAVVGVQPFGGEGLSGTGPKAGGPQLSRALRHRARAHRPTSRPPAATCSCWASGPAAARWSWDEAQPLLALVFPADGIDIALSPKRAAPTWRPCSMTRSK